MTSWTGPIGKVTRRPFSDLCQSLVPTQPFSYSFLDVISITPDFLQPLVDGAAHPMDTVVPFPGRDDAFCSDALTCASKFAHVLQACRSHAHRGAATWAVVDSYHATILGARTLCALFGVLVYSVGDRSVMVDFRPEMGTVEQQRAFQRSYGSMSEPIRILTAQKKHMEQREFWALAKRLFDLARIGADSAASARFKLLGDFAAAFPGGFRNKVLYDCLTWSWRDDVPLLECRCGAGLDSTKSKIAYAQDEMNFLDTVVNEVHAHLSDFAAAATFQMEILPPGIWLAKTNHALVA